MKLFLGILVIFILGVRNGASAETARLPSRCFFCRCPRNQDPQCGSDGRTYSNTCMLNCAKQRCAEMTRGLTARAGPCSTNPLLNAVKLAGNKSILLVKHHLLGQVNFSLKKVSANGNPRNPGDQLIPAEKLEEKCFNCRCTRVKDPQVELGLFCFSGDP